MCNTTYSKLADETYIKLNHNHTSIQCIKTVTTPFYLNYYFLLKVNILHCSTPNEKVKTECMKKKI